MRATLIQNNEKLRDAFEELKKLRVENLDLQEKLSQIESKGGFHAYQNAERKALLEKSNKL
jgi:hypothetical protein